MSGEPQEIDIPFWIETDGYSDRDREMFSAGFEFSDVIDQLLSSKKKFTRQIFTENSSRVRLLCGKFRRLCYITIDREDEKYSTLEVF